MPIQLIEWVNVRNLIGEIPRKGYKISWERIKISWTDFFDMI